MVGDCNDCSVEVGCEIVDRRDCDALEWPIKVPMLEAMRIARDDCGFIAASVVGVIAVTVGMVIVAMFVMVMVVRFVGAVFMAMDVRIVSPAVPMMKQTHVPPRLQLAT